MAYTLKTFGDLVNAICEELKIQAADTTSRNRVKRNLNIVYKEVVAEHDWWWLKKSVDLQVQPYVVAGTASVTQGSSSVTLTEAPVNSLRGYKFSIDGFQEIYTIDSHAAGSTSLKLDGLFSGSTNSTSTYKIWTDRIALPLDCRETSCVYQDYDNQPMEGISLQEFRRVSSALPKAEGKPRFYCTGDFRDPKEVVSNTLPAVATRASTGITKTLIFSGSLPSNLVVGSKIKVSRPGEPSYAGEVYVGTLSTTNNANDTITYTGRGLVDESATADTNMFVELLGSEAKNTRYRELLIHPALTSARVTLHADYLKEVIDLENDNDEPLIPLDDRMVLLYGGLSRDWIRERNPETADRNQSLYDRKLGKMAGKLRESTDQPKLQVSRNYLRAKRNMARGTGLSANLTEGFGAGGSSSPTGNPNKVAVFDSRGFLASSTVDSSAMASLPQIISGLSGDVTAVGPGAVTATVNSVGGSTAANVHSAELSANAATNLNTNNTIVKRDASGNFSAGTITANLTGNVTGNASGTAASITGNLTGDVTSVGMATTVATVGGSTAANVHSAELAANAAVSTNTVSTIVKRDASGNFSAGTISAALSGNATTATTSVNVSGTVAIANGGTGQTAKTAAFDALSPNTTKGDVSIHNGTNNVRVGIGSDGQVLVADSTQSAGVKWAASGGQGGLNLLTLDSSYSSTNLDDSTAEASLGRWAVYADAAGTSPVDMTGGSPGSTVARTTSSPLNGAASILFDLGSGSSRQGEGVVLGPVYVPPGYRGRDLEFTAVWSATGALVEDDLKQYAYDITNSAVLDVVRTSKIIGSAGKWRGVVSVPSTCAQLRIGVHVARTSTAALSIKFDDVKLSDSQTYTGLAGSNWDNSQSSNFTFSGFGTVAAQNIWVKRDGSDWIIRGYVTTGTVAGTTASINLPSQYRIDTAQYSNATNKQRVGVANVIASGTAANVFDSGDGSALFYDGSTNSQIFFGVAGASGSLTKANGTSICASGDTITFENIRIPISGFDANVTLGASSTFKISSYLANGTRVTGSAPTQLGQYRSYLRNASANTYTETSGTPSAAPSGADGIKIWNAAWASGDTSAQPSKYEIFVGKNKNVSFQFYGSAARTGVYDPAPNYSSTFYVGTVKNYDPTTGIVTITGINGSGSTAGAAVGWDGSNGTVNPGFFDIVVSENALAVGIQAPRSEVQAKGSPAAGFGSTNTRIRRFNSAQVNTGTAITYADSATLGGSFTINEDGVYAISYYDYTPAGTAQMGISKNTTGPTTAVFSLTDTEIVCAVTVTSAFRGYCGNTLNLKQGDVIRAHTDGTQGNSQDGTQTRFTITKVSN
jgi:hypothetical protein